MLKRWSDKQNGTPSRYEREWRSASCDGCLEAALVKFENGHGNDIMIKRDNRDDARTHTRRTAEQNAGVSMTPYYGGWSNNYDISRKKTEKRCSSYVCPSRTTAHDLKRFAASITYDYDRSESSARRRGSNGRYQASVQP